MRFIIGNSVTLTAAPPQLEAELQQMFTLANPVFEDAKKRGRWALGIPPHLFFCNRTDSGLSLPRGAGRDIFTKAREHGPVDLIDNRLALPEIDLRFEGQLRAYQQQAINSAMAKDFSVLEAGTGSGKTVMALAVIAARRQPSLVLVHTKELLYQWRDRVQQFLGIEAGLIGDGKYDVQPVTAGIVNSVKKATPDLVERFGHLVMDECHRAPSSMFTETISAFPAKYMTGLSATPYRRDGLTALIGWFIGVHRFQMDMTILHEVGAVLRPKIVTRDTGFRYMYADDYSRMISVLTDDQARNSLIADDIREQAGKGGLTLVVSGRVAHLKTLAELTQVDHAMLTGKTPARKRREIVERLASGDVPVLFSTISLIGEGFDCPAMNSLILATPIRFSGRLKQVVGRVLRPAEGKEPVVYDYTDQRVGVLRHQAKCRQSVFDLM